jgi:hypothetical protein
MTPTEILFNSTYRPYSPLMLSLSPLPTRCRKTNLLSKKELPENPYNPDHS